MPHRSNTPAALSPARRTPRASWRVLVPTLALAIVGALTACGDQPTAPASSLTPTIRVSQDVGATTYPVQVQALLREKALKSPVVVTKTISNGGGNIDVPGTDFKLVVPKGAFAAKEMTFTVTAYAGSAVAYDFQPHGVTWLQPLRAEQKLDHTSWKGFKLPKGYYQVAAAAYFADSSQVDFKSGSALVDEFMSTGVNVDGSTVSWDIPHFSGYIVSWGRR